MILSKLMIEIKRIGPRICIVGRMKFVKSGIIGRSITMITIPVTMLIRFS